MQRRSDDAVPRCEEPPELVDPAPVRYSLRLEPVTALERDTKVIEAKAPGPLFQGVAEADYTCGDCGAVLCAGIVAGHLAGFVFRCLCGATSRVPAP